MKRAARSEREGTIYERGREVGPKYGVLGIVGVEDLRGHIWRGYPAKDRREVLAVLDKALRDIEVFARKGAVVRGTGFMNRLDGLRERSPDLDTDLKEQGLVVMQVYDFNRRFGFDLKTRQGFHPKIWLSIAAPGLVSGLANQFQNGGLEMGFKDQADFDKTLGGLAHHTEHLFEFGLPPRVRSPFSGLEVVNLRLHQLAQKYGKE